MKSIFKKAMILTIVVSMIISVIGQPLQAGAKENWAEAYKKCIEEGDYEIGGFYASLIYLDNDNIPEVYLQAYDTACGAPQILTYYKGEVIVHCVADYAPGGASYAKKKGIVVAGAGHMGYYEEIIWKYSKGKFKELHHGYYEDYQDVNYTWDGKSVSEKKYKAKLKKATAKYQLKDAMDYDKKLTCKELYNVLDALYEAGN